MANYWAEFCVVAGAHLGAVASPGPDFAVVLRQSVAHGRRIAIWTSLGIGAANLLHIGCSLLGLGLLLRNSPGWFTAVKFAGAAYLLWLGVQSLRARPRDPVAAGAPAVPPSTHGAFVTGFLTSALNPKATLFFVSLFVLVVSPATPRLIQAGYGLWMVLVTIAWFTFVALIFTRAGVRDKFLRHGHWIDRALGVVFVAIAVVVAVSSAGR